jgi:hypothetical protein
MIGNLNPMHDSCNLKVVKRGALRLSRMVYSFEAVIFCSVETDVCISFSIEMVTCMLDLYLR